MSGGKCKVNWDLVCKPKERGGLGILNLDKFAMALRLRWLWLEWVDDSKTWIGLGNPCNSMDCEFFAAATRVTIGNGEKAKFWSDPWLEGCCPKDMAPLIYSISTSKNATVSKALYNNWWISKINMDEGLTVDHITQYIALWGKLENVHLAPDEPDSIVWKLSNNGCYSAKSAYMAQFLSLTSSVMPTLVWKPWAPPKCKLFAWLVLQNRIWTADRLERRGWDNCGRCKLCNRVQESAAHLLFQCSFSSRVWTVVKSWLGMHDIFPSDWRVIPTVKDWWEEVIHGVSQHGKALASLAMLVSWELWKERNARIYRNQSSTIKMVANKIKDETRLWSLAGAKALSVLMPRE